MKGIIKESAIRWKGKNPNKQYEMVEGIIKTIEYWQIMNEKRKQTAQNEELIDDIKAES